MTRTMQIIAPPRFVKFPRTPHVFWLGKGEPRDDKIVSYGERQMYLSKLVAVIVEEKVDGANIGISFDEGGNLWTQSRGDYFGPCVFRKSHRQFDPLWAWLAEREDRLRDALGEDMVLFGEWCYAEHSIHYDALPDWFLAFDVYHRRLPGFLLKREVEELVAEVGLTPVPRLAETTLTEARLMELLKRRSTLRSNGPMEGVYLRQDTLGARAKLVNPDFTQAIDEHWTKRPLAKNEMRRPRGAGARQCS